MSDDAVKITVGYNGREKRIPLVVQPSLELSDFQVDQAELELCGIVRHVFSVPAEAGFSLHEAETDRILTKESFRDPSNLQRFPTHWYLTLEKPAEVGEEEGEGDKCEELTSAFDLYADQLPDMEDALPSLAELSLAEAKYQSISLTAGPEGEFGVTLRYFSIQPANASRVDSPTDPPLFGADSQNSQQSSGSLDILSTTFVYRVEEAGQEAGLHEGDTVHMINGSSIIRSSFSEIQDLLAQCGSELMLMVLPKEHDDLQFLYPQYTEGSVGEYTSGDEKVTARDIPVVVGSTSPQGERVVDSRGEGGRRGRQTGSYQFAGSATSLDRTHSNSSSEQMPQAGDDSLINCSIYDIPVTSSSPSKDSFHAGWGSVGNRSGTGSNSQLDRLDENEAYVPPSWKGAGLGGIANGDLRYEYQHREQAVDPSWYQDPEENCETTSPSSQPGQDPVRNGDRVVQAHSQDSAVGHRISLQSTGGEESHSQPAWDEGRSADLGVVRIKKKHSKKSLEMLTSLSTTLAPRGMRRIHSDDVIGQNSREHNYENVEGESGTGSRKNSLEQNAHTNTTPTAKVPPSPGAMDTPTATPTHKQGSEVRVRKAARSYSSQRQQLHKSRSRGGDDQAATKRAESLVKSFSQPVNGEGDEEGRKGQLYLEPGITDRQTSLTTPQESQRVREEEETASTEQLASPIEQVVTPTIRVAPQQQEVTEAGGEGGRRDRYMKEGSHTLRHQGSSPPMSPRSYQSATLDPRVHRSPFMGDMGLGGPPDKKHQLTKSVEVPLLVEGANRRLPLVKTRSAQTPFGTQIVRELNIDEAVAASQGSTAMHRVQHTGSRALSMDCGVVSGVGSEGGRGAIGIFPAPYHLRRQSLISTGPEERTSRNVACHGLLNKKQVSEGQGRKSSDRSWRTFYTVLVGTHMVFYKERREADANKPCEEPPLEVVPGRADLTHGYTKRKCVFRVVTAQGAEFLLQCEDSQSMLHWVTTIHRLNGNKMVEQPRPKPEMKLLSPASPLASRRNSSPQPQSLTQGRAGRRKGSGFVSGLKNALNRKKGSNAPSELSFGQLLADCPMSSDNKCVPLVVEFCVREVEEHGLEVEGLYRKPGQGSLIKSLVAEIDKGQFEFEEYGDIHTIGSLLKKFFQELPDALIPGDRYKEFLAVVMETPGETEQVMRLRGLAFHLPMAHYHTLRYLTRHLNRVVENAHHNKMVLRNVAMVFGPTLMLRSSPSEEFDLAAMNTTFTVVELLCKHWDNIFDSETCYEEQQLERERERERQREEAQRETEVAGGGLSAAHRTSSDPAVNSLKIKKDHALINASPKMVRRIKNQLSTSKKTAERNSYSGGEALMATSLSRKQHNRSDTLPAYSNTPMAALLSPSHIPTPRAWGRAGSSGTLQTVRRPREGDSGYGGDLNPHARYPGGRERDGEWGGVAGREHTGSIWAKGKEPQRGRGSGKRDSAGREREREDKRERKEGQSRSQLLSSHPPPPPIAHQTELLMSYQHPSPLHSTHSHRHNHTSAAHDLLHRSATLPPSPEHHGALSPRHNSGKKSSNTLPTPSSPGMRRKISYNMAVGEFDRPPPSSSYGSYHQPRSGDQLPYSTPENIREREFSRSYAPQSSARSANQSTIGQSGTHSSRQSGSHSRTYQSYGPERGESAQKSRRNHESYL